MFITEAVIEDETGTLKVIWFNQPFLMKNLKTNDWISIAGRLSKEKMVLILYLLITKKYINKIFLIDAKLLV